MKFQEMEEKMRQQKEKSKKPSEDELQDNRIDDLQPPTATTLESTEEETDSLTDELNTKTPLITNSNASIKPAAKPTFHFIFDDDPIEDLAEKGSIDTYEPDHQVTTIAPPLESLNLNPIVVSSTMPAIAYPKALPTDLIDDHLEQDQVESSEENYQQLRSIQTTTSSSAVPVRKVKAKPKPKMIVSVEKVNVIEIKPDGVTGHIIPAEFLQNNKK